MSSDCQLAGPHESTQRLGRYCAVRKLLSFPVLLGMFLVGAAIIGARFNLPDPDLWSHIAIGREILRTRALPVTDTYSFTAPGNESLALEWLGEVAIASVARSFGLRGLLTLLWILAATTMLLLYSFAYQRSGNARAAFGSCLIILPLVAAFFTLRPQLLGYIFLLIELICLEAFRKDNRKALWVLPFLFVLWVNIHGSFALGLLVLVGYWASGLVEFSSGNLKGVRWTFADRQRLELISLFCLISLVVTPYGTRSLGSTLHVIWNAKLGMAHITEYEPLGASGDLLQMFLLIVLAFLCALVVFRPAFRLEEVGLFLAGLYGACVHSRLVLLFVVAFAPLLSKLLVQWLPPYEPSRDRPALNFAFLCLLCLALTRFFPSAPDLENEIAAKYPARALAYLQLNPVKGQMLNDYDWGGYLMWTAGSHQNVFIDGRSQLYEDAGVYADYLNMMALAPDTLSLVRKYNLQGCLLKRDSMLATLLISQPDWQLVYSDDVSAIVVRKRQVQSAKSDHPPSSGSLVHRS